MNPALRLHSPKRRGFADSDVPTDGCSECFVETVQSMTPPGLPSVTCARVGA